VAGFRPYEFERYPLQLVSRNTLFPQGIQRQDTFVRNTAHKDKQQLVLDTCTVDEKGVSYYCQNGDKILSTHVMRRELYGVPVSKSSQ